MNAQTKIEAPSGLALLRMPFAPNHISKLPKPTKAQTDAVKADYKAGIRCEECGAWHHPKVVHLDYVGHAALTDRLLDCDPEWSWEPAALRDGLPAFDNGGGLWIKLTVCGVTRLGYGNAAGKQNGDPGNREKEVIGDALRNAAMRFGAALDLWHKGDLHADQPEDASGDQSSPKLITPSQQGLLHTLLQTTRANTTAFLKAYQIKSLEEMPAEAFADAKDKLDRKMVKLIAEETAKKAEGEFAGVTEADCPF